MGEQRDLAYLRDLIQYRAAPFVAGVTINTTDDSCALCRFIAGSYEKHCPPELPRECENEFGCTVWWIPVFDTEAPSTPWRTEDTPMDKDEIRRGVAIDQCALQIEQCLKLLSNPKTRSKTRNFRIQLLLEEIAKMTSLDPANPLIKIARQAARLY